ncbi:MAG: alpha-ketoglutarate dehydrogenase [Pseudomonadota bacterium]
MTEPIADDPERQEWAEAFDALIRYEGPQAAAAMLTMLERQAEERGLKHRPLPYTAYRNTISLEEQPPFPGDIRLEERLTAIMRWNALAMVMRANKAYGDLGGHIASYASAAEIFEVGFNHFFRAGEASDLVYFQPHSAPGVYSRAFLEGRLSEETLARYRQEIGGRNATGGGLCSYPHPWLMPEFWQVPTGSMGLGPLSAVYTARFMRYLSARGLAKTEGRHVWGVFGDGEMDEPESLAGLSLAAREGLDNLTFVVNCNLQRLDGPVRGNGQIIQELEALFHGAGWNVIKVLWGGDWDVLFARDHNHALLRRFAATVDGKYQTLGAKDGAYNLKNFFQEDPETAKIVSHMSDADVDRLRRGGHDFRKLYAAFAAAKAHQGQPTVILAKTKKGFGMGRAGESRMTAHQAKKLDIDALKEFRDRFALPLSDEKLAALEFIKLPEDSEEIRYLRARRAALGGPLPARRTVAAPVAAPARQGWAGFAAEADGKEMSSTMAFVRMLSGLLKDKALGPRIVPIVADEARTFGMANLFRQIGIYAPGGQNYEPEDSGSLLLYREAEDGQLLEEGITEAGALASWTAAATAYSTHGVAMLPVYIYYSMFGFQRVGDLIWAAADQRSRGFLIGATAGRTTLGGEGLQHQDGSSHLAAATIPNCRAYDPCYAYEIAILVEHGLRRMLEEQRDEFFYLTVMNETYPQPSLPGGDADPSIEEGVIRGLHRLSEAAPNAPKARVRLLGAGAILREVEAAATMLADDWGVAAEVFSATSFSELEREARAVERRNRLNPKAEPERAHLERLLPGTDPVIAATDYVRAVPHMIAPYLDAPFTALGTDGFGRSDTRAALRAFFEVDRRHIVLAALDRLARQSRIERRTLAEALERYGVDAEAPAPWTV